MRNLMNLTETLSINSSEEAEIAAYEHGYEVDMWTLVGDGRGPIVGFEMHPEHGPVAVVDYEETGQLERVPLDELIRVESHDESNDESYGDS